MTTIIANKEGMASDSQMTDGNIKSSVPKIWRIRGWLVAGGGSYHEIVKLINTIKEQKEFSPIKVMAEVELEKTEDCDLLFLSPAGKLFVTENGSEAMTVSDPFYAIGTGAQAALAAMHMGATPREAVRIAAKIDANTGGRIVWKTI
jgi:ATP-dependent protease HslVU (ClpYQ) peptidase subunit